MSKQIDTSVAEIPLADFERGQRIKQARIKGNFSTGQLARAMDLTPGSVSQWESGRTRPNRERLKKLCELLNCSPAWIEGRTQGTGANTDAARRFVPLVSMEQATRGISWESGDIGPDNGVQVFEPCSASAFAIKIESKRYLPAVSKGAVLVIDPALKEEIQQSNVVFTTTEGRPELLQAFPIEPLAHVYQTMIEYDTDPALRTKVLQKLIADTARLGPLIYFHLADGTRADMKDMRIIGPVIQKIEGRVWPGMNPAVLAYTTAALGGGVGLAGDRAPEEDDVAQGILAGKDGA